MEWFEALILGLVQGLTEYLPVRNLKGDIVQGGEFTELLGYILTFKHNRERL